MQTGYVRPLTTRSMFRRGTTFYALKVDLHNRRITTRVGKVGSRGRTVVRTFPTRDDAREFEQTVRERRDLLKYVQVA